MDFSLTGFFQELTKGNMEDANAAQVAFAQIIKFLQHFPEELSWRGKNKPDPSTSDGVRALAEKYYQGYTCSHFPKISKLIPDDVVSMIMEEAYDINASDRQSNKDIHSKAMSAENCLGQLLEKYIDSVTCNSDGSGLLEI